MKVSLSTIKDWFKTGLKPTEQQFSDTYDSFWHKDDSIPNSSISGMSGFATQANLDSVNANLNALDQREISDVSILQSGISSLQNQVNNINLEIAGYNSGELTKWRNSNYIMIFSQSLPGFYYLCETTKDDNGAPTGITILSSGMLPNENFPNGDNYVLTSAYAVVNNLRTLVVVRRYQIYTSFDLGETWQSQTLLSGNKARVVWLPIWKEFLLIDDSAPSRALWSKDGLTWNEITGDGALVDNMNVALFNYDTAGASSLVYVLSGGYLGSQVQTYQYNGSTHTFTKKTSTQNVAGQICQGYLVDIDPVTHLLVDNKGNIGKQNLDSNGVIYFAQNASSPVASENVICISHEGTTNIISAGSADRIWYFGNVTQGVQPTLNEYQVVAEVYPLNSSQMGRVILTQPLTLGGTTMESLFCAKLENGKVNLYVDTDTGWKSIEINEPQLPANMLLLRDNKLLNKTLKLNAEGEVVLA